MYNTNICWFMSNIVSIFYSQRSRSIVMNRSYLWDTKGSVYSLFKKVLYDRYLTVGHLRQSDEYNDFKEDIFFDMLRILHQMDNKKFLYNHNKYKNVGFLEYYYIGKLYTLLGIDYKMFDFDQSSMLFSYSTFNKEYEDLVSIKLVSEETGIWICEDDGIDIDVYKDDGLAPNILIINVSPTNVIHQFRNNIIDDMEIRPNLTTMADEIEYNGYVYILDSVVLMNFNNVPPMNHVIVGMTCKKKKYIYNGLPYMGNRGHPCHLIKHDWNIRSDKNFYLSDNDCVMHDIPKQFNERCFNFSEGRRMLIYVRKNVFGTSSSKEMDIPKYQNLLIQREAFEVELKKRRDFEIRQRMEAEARRVSAERKLREYKARLAYDIDTAIKKTLEQKARRLSAERKEAEARRLSAERKEAEARRLLDKRNKEYQKRKRLNYEIDELANIIQGLKLKSPPKKQETGNVEIIPIVPKPKPKAKPKANPKTKAKTKANPKTKAKANPKTNIKDKIEKIIKKQRLKSRSSSL